MKSLSIPSLVLGAVLAMPALTGCSDPGSDSAPPMEQSAAQSEQPAPTPMPTAKMGDPVVDQDPDGPAPDLEGTPYDWSSEFTVTKVETGVELIKSNTEVVEDAKPANGQFVVLHVKVKNVGKTPNTPATSELQYLIQDGTRYAGIDLMGADCRDELDKSLQPGTSAEGCYFFDVPDAVVPQQAELHAQWPHNGSAGVLVQLQ
ncbi:DUF4352 domain-containing protein [Sphaerisporangium perillae]|uniref:DUF4352 domain-containing protein n=1 Tax=Sphaerisporangium perillae TaxID=2935860 RepID=UPI00200E07F9|nr:DUF4352 domain-containing protein [Sphaerisporangium perillae]